MVKKVIKILRSVLPNEVTQRSSLELDQLANEKPANQLNFTPEDRTRTEHTFLFLGCTGTRESLDCASTLTLQHALNACRCLVLGRSFIITGQ